MHVEVLSMPVSWLSNHPILDRVCLVSEAADQLREYHHGDPERQERASDLRDDWAAWVQDIRDNGVLEPLKVVKDPDQEGNKYLVIDGRHRLQAARDAGKKEVPCVIVHEEDIHAHMEGSVIARRHWSKSMLAYFCVLLHPDLTVENTRGGDRKTIKPQKMRFDPMTREMLAERFGVSLRLLEDAIWIYRELDKHPGLRPRIEPSLWAGVPLMRLRLGIEGATATIDQPRRPASPDSASWSKYVNGLRTRLDAWPSWSEEQRIRFAGDWRKLASNLPDDARRVMLEALTEVADDPAAEEDTGPIEIDPFHTAPFAAGTGALSDGPAALATPVLPSSPAPVPVGSDGLGSLTCDRCGRHGFTVAGLSRHRVLCATSTSRPVSA